MNNSLNDADKTENFLKSNKIRNKKIKRQG